MICSHGMPSPASCVECMYDDGLGAEPVAPLTVDGPAFAAKFGGDCTRCHLVIHEGQRIVRLSDERYVHEGCAP